MPGCTVLPDQPCRPRDDFIVLTSQAQRRPRWSTSQPHKTLQIGEQGHLLPLAHHKRLCRILRACWSYPCLCPLRLHLAPGAAPGAEPQHPQAAERGGGLAGRRCLLLSCRHHTTHSQVLRRAWSPCVSCDRRGQGCITWCSVTQLSHVLRPPCCNFALRLGTSGMAESSVRHGYAGAELVLAGAFAASRRAAQCRLAACRTRVCEQVSMHPSPPIDATSIPSPAVRHRTFLVQVAAGGGAAERPLASHAGEAHVPASGLQRLPGSGEDAGRVCGARPQPVQGERWNHGHAKRLPRRQGCGSAVHSCTPVLHAVLAWSMACHVLCIPLQLPTPDGAAVIHAQRKA